MIIIKIKTAYRLGLCNLVRVVNYRLGIKFGINPVKKTQATIKLGVFFRSPERLTNVDLKRSNQQRYFGWKFRTSSDVPNWHQSVFSGTAVDNPMRSWWEIPDFSAELGDIKGVWESSRFDWVLGYSQLATQGDSIALEKLNTWLSDWSIKNAPYKGINWKCGQEASIRVMHLAMAALLLDQHTNSSEALLSLIKAHLKRIFPTLSYAMAQDNNHGTSEAASLFIGGSWLIACGDNDGYVYYNKGRKTLENRAVRLIEHDGSFSQHSTVYHRVMLDTYSMVEVWRSELDLPCFSEQLNERLRTATNWLYQFSQNGNGDVPNLGANDGARLFQLTQTDYRDFRPSVQLASVLFFKASAWKEEGDYDLPLKWLNIIKPQKSHLIQDSFHFPEGGYFGLRGINNKAFAMMTYPKFNFRPSQCDALHLDFWLDGQNLLRDGGTFSYNAGVKYIEYYGGTESHNTVQFDGHDQMPRLSRFLLGSWLKAKDVTCDLKQRYCQASYKDYLGCYHKREVTLFDDRLLVIDTNKGFKSKSILRWRLKPDNWSIDGNTVTNGSHVIKVNSDTEIVRFELVEGKESRYYYQETSIPVLEVEISLDGKITTEYQFHS